jgi:hypothetical protein
VHVGADAVRRRDEHVRRALAGAVDEPRRFRFRAEAGLLASSEEGVADQVVGFVVEGAGPLARQHVGAKVVEREAAVRT